MRAASFNEANRWLHAKLCRFGKKTIFLNLALLGIIAIYPNLKEISFWTHQNLAHLNLWSFFIQYISSILYFLLILGFFYSLHYWGISARLSGILSLFLSLIVWAVSEVIIPHRLLEMPASLFNSNSIPILIGILFGFLSIQYWIFMNFTGQWEVD